MAGGFSRACRSAIVSAGGLVVSHARLAAPPVAFFLARNADQRQSRSTSLALLPERIRASVKIRWLRSLHSLHHRLPAFGPPGRSGMPPCASETDLKSPACCRVGRAPGLWAIDS